MEKNEIKKELYRQKPEADLIEVSKDGIRYSTTISSVEGLKLIVEVPAIVPLGFVQ